MLCTSQYASALCLSKASYTNIRDDTLSILVQQQVALLQNLPVCHV